MGSRNDDIGVFGHTIVPAQVNANGTHHRDDLTKLLHIVVFGGLLAHRHQLPKLRLVRKEVGGLDQPLEPVNDERILPPKRSEEHTYELPSLMRRSYDVFGFNTQTIYTQK